jgi:hypothetical protein
MRVVACVMLGSLAAHAVVEAQSDRWTVYLRRAGPLHIGMSLSQVRTALEDPKAFLAGIPAESVDQCAYVNSTRLPAPLGLMVQGGRVVRIDVRGPGIHTASGIQVGSTEGDVKRTYGPRIRIEPHKYDPDGHYLEYVAVDAADRPFGLLFETDGRRVTSFRAGTVAAIALVEGCA